MAASLLLGLHAYSPATAVEAFLHYDPSRNSHVVLLDSRLPRALIGPAVGAALAASGLLVQSIIRSPIVSPTVLGINAGSGFAVVAATFAFGTLPSAVLQGFSLLGALATGAVVLLFSFLLQSARRDTSILLLGAAVASLFQALTQTLLTVSEATLQEVLYWLAGSVQGRSLDSLRLAAPLIAVSLGIGFITSPHLDLLRLGERSARTLGQRVIVIQTAALTAAAMLAGAAVFAAGPVGFVGLVVPHLVRRIRPGPHWRQLIVAVLLGGTSVTMADLLARYVVYPNEVPVGVITASLGVPALIRIVVLGRRNNAAAL
jgi:iron complex transport system permease protein